MVDEGGERSEAGEVVEAGEVGEGLETLVETARGRSGPASPCRPILRCGFD